MQNQGYLKNLCANFLLKDPTTAVAILDAEMRFIDHSDHWLEAFDLSGTSIVGKPLYEIITYIPNELKEVFEHCLCGNSNFNKDKKFVLPNGIVKWFKWKINVWEDENADIKGLIVVLEDITTEKRRLELLQIAENVARIGGWEVNLTTNEVYWTNVTKEIHEVAADYVPNLEESINFYKEGEYRELIEEKVSRAITDGSPWDTELIIVTAKGNEVWVRAKGETEMLNGKCIRLMGTFQDISDKKKAALQSKAATERLAVATKGANIGIWDYNIAKNELVWDDNMYALYGIGKNDFKVVYEAWQAGLHPEDREKCNRAVAMAMAGEKEFDTEFRVVWPNGEIKYIKATAVTQKDENGKTLKMIGTNWDITKRVKAELKHKETIELLNAATRAANIGIWDLNLEENEVVCNSELYKMFEMPQDTPVLLNEWINTIHPEDRERVSKELRLTITKDKPFNTKLRCIKPNGDIIHLIAFGESQKGANGRVKNIIGTNWDITELRTTKLLLEQSQESFENTFKNSSVGMALVARDGGWIQVNKAICDSLGYPEEELLKIRFQDVTHPDDIGKDIELLKEVLDSKRDSYQIEKRYIHKSGRLVYAMLTVTAVKDIQGELIHFISQILDITSRIEAEKSTKKLLQVAKRQNDSLLNFAHIVSHNLRSHSSNLSMLSGFLSTEEDEAEKANLLTMLKNASGSLNETVMHLNEVVKVKAGAVEKMKSVNIYEIIKNVEKNLSALIKEKNASCTVDIPKNLKIKGIPAYFDSIFLNLFSNSLKYNDPAKIPTVNITTDINKNTVCICFEDNGLGIDLKRHGEKLFGMYKTFHRNKDAKGIGLFITKNQIEAMNGSVAVESEVGKGTKFLLKFKK